GRQRVALVDPVHRPERSVHAPRRRGSMKKKPWQISRRTMLQTAGTAIALPVLEAMLRPRRLHADGAPPRRFLAMHGLVYGYVGRDDEELGTMVAPWSATAPGYDVPIENNTYLKPFFD